MIDYRGRSWCDRIIEEGVGVIEYSGKSWRESL